LWLLPPDERPAAALSIAAGRRYEPSYRELAKAADVSVQTFRNWRRRIAAPIRPKRKPEPFVPIQPAAAPAAPKASPTVSMVAADLVAALQKGDPDLLLQFAVLAERNRAARANGVAQSL
jgi:hypothetical protein